MPAPADNRVTAGDIVGRIVRVRGRVQGVGFRPFVYRLARDLGLAGRVANSPAGVAIEIEGPAAMVARFVEGLERDAPPRAQIVAVDVTAAEPTGASGFVVAPSRTDEATVAGVRLLPDLAMCDACRAELHDPANRRHGYPFIVCTDCGPRWSILDDLPWDRPRTAMAGFVMCDECQREYETPADRRFHAEPIACPTCGPRLDSALAGAADAIRDGRIVALKGLGGFHLIGDATNDTAVATLRERKQRPTKPLAVMVATLADAKRLCEVDADAARVLASPEAPIVLLPARSGNGIAANVAPGSAELGVMLAYTPLHTLLLAQLDGRPIVATSGNRSGEPIATNDASPIADLADAVVTHDRPIRRPVDDSVVRVIDGAPFVIRAARGHAPLTLDLPADGPTVLAVGAHLKATVALATGRQLIVSPHIGDLESAATARVHRETIETLLRLTKCTPDAVAHDLHPDYHSTRVAHELADQFGVPVIAVQHHHAHALATLAEHDGLDEPALAVTWDGTGYGTDGTVWGGEFLRVTGASFERVAHLRPFRLPGGDAAARDPRRCALGLLHELGWLDDAPDHLRGLFDTPEWRLIRSALERGVNAPVTTSAGRLFDALAALLDLCSCNTFEGEAAIRLEHAQRDRPAETPWSMPLVDGQLDTGPLIREVLRGLAAGRPTDWLASRIHATLASGINEVARAVGAETLVLTGGCFQNVTLLDRVRESHPAHTRWPRRVPANDGGIAVGQAVAARLMMKE